MQPDGADQISQTSVGAIHGQGWAASEGRPRGPMPEEETAPVYTWKVLQPEQLADPTPSHGNRTIGRTWGSCPFPRGGHEMSVHPPVSGHSSESRIPLSRILVYLSVQTTIFTFVWFTNFLCCFFCYVSSLSLSLTVLLCDSLSKIMF